MLLALHYAAVRTLRGIRDSQTGQQTGLCLRRPAKVTRRGAAVFGRAQVNFMRGPVLDPTSDV